MCERLRTVANMRLLCRAICGWRPFDRSNATFTTMFDPTYILQIVTGTAPTRFKRVLVV
jgi:hypothetical protein